MSRLRCLGLHEIKTAVFWRDVTQEAITSLILLSFLMGNMMTFAFVGDWVPTPTHIGLVMGLLVFILVQSFGPYGGANMNPGITFVFFCRGDLKFVKGNCSF